MRNSQIEINSSPHTPFFSQFPEKMKIEGHLEIELDKKLNAVYVFFINAKTGHFTLIETYYLEKGFHKQCPAHSNVRGFIKNILRQRDHVEERALEKFPLFFSLECRRAWRRKAVYAPVGENDGQPDEAKEWSDFDPDA